MTTYQVTLNTTNGSTTYSVQGNSIKQVSYNVEQSIIGRSEVRNFTIESVQKEITPDAMHGLYQATGGLIACIIILIVAEYKIRKWLTY